MTAQINASLNVPNPDVISAYSHGWKTLWKPFWMLLLIGIILAAISIGVSFIPFVSFLAAIFLVTPLGYGMSYAFLKAVRGEQVEVNDLFMTFKNYWNAVGVGFLQSLIMSIPAIILMLIGMLFIGNFSRAFDYTDFGFTGVSVAGVIFGLLFFLAAFACIIFLQCKLSFIPYLITDRKMGPVEAIKNSWMMTNGYFWQLVLILLLGFAVMIAGILCLVVGIIVAYMWIAMANASIYYAVSLKNPSPVVVQSNTAPPPAQ